MKKALLGPILFVLVLFATGLAFAQHGSLPPQGSSAKALTELPTQTLKQIT